MKMKQDKTRKKGYRMVVFIMAVAVIGGTYVLATHGGNLFSKKEYIVGSDIRQEAITDFYYTYDSSTNPPHFQRYRFFIEEGKPFFYHETREGNSWPLQEEDISVSGKLALSEAEWDTFFGLMKDGVVKSREEDVSSGNAGPWLFLYWKNDQGKIQAFHFASWDIQKQFEAFCEELKKRT